MNLIGDPQYLVTDGDGGLGQTIRHLRGGAVIGAGVAGAVGGAGAMTARCDGRFEG